MEIIDKKSLTQKNEYSQQERPYIIALGKALQKNNIPETYYSLHGYGESCICLQKQGERWVVYEGEKEMKFNALDHSNINDACNNLINRIADKSNVEKIRNDFYVFLYLSLRATSNRRFPKTLAKNTSHTMRPAYSARYLRNAVARKRIDSLMTNLEKAACIDATKDITVGIHAARGKASSPQRSSAMIKKKRIKLKKQR